MGGERRLKARAQGSVRGGREGRCSVCCSYAVRMIRKPDLGLGVSQAGYARNVVATEQAGPGEAGDLYLYCNWRPSGGIGGEVD